MDTLQDFGGSLSAKSEQGKQMHVCRKVAEIRGQRNDQMHSDGSRSHSFRVTGCKNECIEMFRYRPSSSAASRR